MRVRDLLPAVLVVVLALVAPSFGRDECASTDGPQFLCYLRAQR
jgi:hypothetical protein